jgi:hypothetical protein
MGYETRQIQVFTPDRAAACNREQGAGGHTFVEMKYGSSNVDVWRMFDATWGLYWHRTGTFVGDVLSTQEVVQHRSGQIEAEQVLSGAAYWTRVTQELGAADSSGLNWYLWNPMETWAPGDVLLFRQ